VAKQLVMDAIWYGIGAFSEWLFDLIKPMGRLTNIFFIAVGFIGTAFWLWYTVFVNKGGRNYMAENAKK